MSGSEANAQSFRKIIALSTPDYPEQEHARLHQLMEEAFERLVTPDEKRLEFRSSQNAVFYRYKGCHDAAEEYAALVTAHGDGPPQPIRYQQEHQLFVGIVAGLASLEALHYALYMAGSAFDAQAFPFATQDSRWKIKAAVIRAAFEGWKNAPELSEAMAEVHKAPEFLVWKKARNVLSHRLTPGRRFSLSAGGPPIDDVAHYHGIGEPPGLVVSPSTVREVARWVRKSVALILQAAVLSFSRQRH